MRQYLDMLQYILDNGEVRPDRTGTGTVSVFGYEYRHDLGEGFPLLTTKDMTESFKNVFYELMWFIKGRTDLKYLLDHGVNIWNDDAYRGYLNKLKEELGEGYIPLSKKGFIEHARNDEFANPYFADLGDIYGKQWRDSNGVDQLAEVENLLKNDPYSRRIIINAWNPSAVYDKKTVLPPCHVMVQLYVSRETDKLSAKVTMRGTDSFLGNAYNLPSYALLTIMLAHKYGFGLGEIIMSIGDAHIYSNHVDAVKTQLSREPFPLPTLKIVNPKNDITKYEIEDFELEGYLHHEKIRANLSVGK